jgi:hypothetical protein
VDTNAIPLGRLTVDPEIETHCSSRWDDAARLSSTAKGRFEQARLYDFLGQWLPPAHTRRRDSPRRLCVGAGPGTRRSPA